MPGKRSAGETSRPGRPSARPAPAPRVRSRAPPSAGRPARSSEGSSARLPERSRETRSPSEFDATEEARVLARDISRPGHTARRDRDFSYYEPAYRYGWESARRYAGDPRSFEEIEPELADGWLSWMVGDSSPGREWHELREAVRDAWQRIRGS